MLCVLLSQKVNFPVPGMFLWVKLWLGGGRGGIGCAVGGVRIFLFYRLCCLRTEDFSNLQNHEGVDSFVGADFFLGRSSSFAAAGVCVAIPLRWLLGAQLFQAAGYPQVKGDAEDAGEDVRDGLGEHDALQPHEAGEDEDGGDEEQPLAADADEGAADGHTDDLEEHVGRGGQSHSREGYALIAQHLYADGEHDGVFVAVEGDDARRQDDACHGQQHEEEGGEGDGEEVGLAHAGVLLRPVVVARHGLEALVDAQHEGEGEHHGAGDDGEGCHRGGLAARGGVARGGVVETDGGGAVEDLAAQRGQPAHEDLVVGVARGTEVAEGDVDAAGLGGAPEEQAPADGLADGGG